MKQFSLEECVTEYLKAGRDRQLAGLKAFLAALTGQNETAPPRKRRMSLKAAAAEIGRHPSVLWRLGVVENCGESYSGGRKVYDPDEIISYLKSPECAAKREQLRIARLSQLKETK
jgi:hypothetical protein